MSKILFKVLSVIWLSLLLSNCNSSENPTSKYYYAVIEDKEESFLSPDRYVFSEIIEEKNDSDAIKRVVGKINSALYAEATVTSIPNSITKRKPHQFVANLFDENGRVPISEEIANYINKYVTELIDKSTLWSTEDKYKKAFDYYKINTNFFDSPSEIFLRGGNFAEDHKWHFNVVSALQNKYAQDEVKNHNPVMGLILKSGLTIIVIILILLIGSVILSKNNNAEKEHKKKPVLRMLNREGDLREDERHTYIAGVNHHASKAEKEHKKKPILRMLNREGDLHEDEWHTYIAGVPYHASKHDVGGFSGWVENDFLNKHDRRAMGVYNSFGKLLGYIPAKELPDYREWCDAQPQPCVGFIFIEDGQLRGRVKILRPCNEEFLEKEFSRYLQWVKDNYGAEYLPKSMRMTFDIEP